MPQTGETHTSLKHLRVEIVPECVTASLLMMQTR